MFKTTDTTEALARARNDGLKLDKAKSGVDEKTTKEDPGIGGTLESLAAVIPTGITTAYTAAVLVARGLALSQGADERAEVQAALVKAGKTESEITKLLKTLPQETEKWVNYRWLLLGGAGVAATIIIARAAFAGNAKAAKKRSTLRILFAEPLVALIAFAGWSLAAPGTPMAARMNSADLTIFTIVFGTCAFFALLAMGKVTLTKKASTGEDPAPDPKPDPKP